MTTTSDNSEPGQPLGIALTDQLDAGCAPAAPMRESGWLIEGSADWPRPRWLRISCNGSVNGIPRGELEWTQDANIALRFARECDAKAFALLHPQWATLARVTQHLFGI